MLEKGTSRRTRERKRFNCVKSAGIAVCDGLNRRKLELFVPDNRGKTDRTMQISFQFFSSSAYSNRKRNSLIFSSTMELVLVSFLFIIPSVFGAVVPFPSGKFNVLH